MKPTSNYHGKSQGCQPGKTALCWTLKFLMVLMNGLQVATMNSAFELASVLQTSLMFQPSSARAYFPFIFFNG